MHSYQNIETYALCQMCKVNSGSESDMRERTLQTDNRQAEADVNKYFDQE